MISIIVAATVDNAIGINGNQPYYISGDLKRFKELTTNNTVIMGRKTFEALPKGALPNRKNIVVTRSADFNAPGVIAVNSIDEAISRIEGEGFVIGGGEIYRQAIKKADCIYLTRIDAMCPNADVFFPEIIESEWLREESPYFHDERNDVDYQFIVLRRK